MVAPPGASKDQVCDLASPPTRLRRRFVSGLLRLQDRAAVAIASHGAKVEQSPQKPCTKPVHHVVLPNPGIHT